MSTRLKGWIAAPLKEADKVEQAMREIRDGLWLRSAVGPQLDMLGRVYGEKRIGRLDDDYRLAIQLKAATVVNGTPDEIMVFMQLIYGSQSFEYVPEYPAGFWIVSDVVPSPEQLERISPAGVAAFPGSWLITTNNEYITTTTGERLMVVATDTRGAALADTLDAALDTWSDSLDPTADIVAAT